MKIIVGVKRVIDYNVRVKVAADNSDVDLENVKMAMNPFDEVAVEEALRLREAGLASEVIAVTVGQENSQDVLRSALAVGVDRAILVNSTRPALSLTVAKALAALVTRESASLVLLGKQSIDQDANQTPQMLAALCDWPQATFVSELEVTSEKVIAVREVDSGMIKVEMPVPSVVSVDLRLNEPRYASLPNIMKAKRKPIESLSLDELGVEERQHQELLSVVRPPAREGGKIVASVEEAIAEMKEAGVI